MGRQSRDIQPDGLPNLSGMERRFVEAYLGRCKCNAAAAARAAGYNIATNDDGNAYRVLNRPAVRAHISARIEQACIDKNEVLARLSAIARADLSLCIDEHGGLDLQRLIESGQGFLLKGLKRRIGPFGESHTVELYDAQAALVQLGKWLGLTERINISTLTDDQLTELLNRAFAEDKK